jgi:hypothetical protein
MKVTGVTTSIANQLKTCRIISPAKPLASDAARRTRTGDWLKKKINKVYPVANRFAGIRKAQIATQLLWEKLSKLARSNAGISYNLLRFFGVGSFRITSYLSLPNSIANGSKASKKIK